MKISYSIFSFQLTLYQYFGMMAIITRNVKSSLMRDLKVKNIRKRVGVKEKIISLQSLK